MEQNPSEPPSVGEHVDSDAGAAHPTGTRRILIPQSSSGRVIARESPVSVGVASPLVPSESHSFSSPRYDAARSPACSESNKGLSLSSVSHHLELRDRSVLEGLTHLTPILQRRTQDSLVSYKTNDALEEAGVSSNKITLDLQHGDGEAVEKEEIIDIHSLNERLSDVLDGSGQSFMSLSHRTELHSSLSRAAFHIFKGNVGAGVFLLPTYYQDTGYCVGVVLVVLLGALMIDCALALLCSKQKIDRTDVRTYPAVVEHILGPTLMHFTRFSLIFTQFGFCVVYMQYASSMFAALFGSPQMYYIFIIVCVTVVTPMTFFSHRMEVLAYASIMAAVFVALVLAGAAAEGVSSLSTQGVASGAAFFVPTMSVLMFISGHMFSLEGIGIVLPVENSMSPDDRPQFCRLVKYTLSAVVMLYIVFGVLGYLAFGETLQTSVVLALPPSPMKSLLQVLLGLSLLFGYPIQFVPAIQLVDRSLQISMRNEMEKALFVRVFLNVLFGTLAGSIGADTINIFASFLGAFTGVHLMVTMPVLLALLTDMVLDSANSGRGREELSFGDYVSFLLTPPRSAAEYRWYAYLLFAMVVSVGGTYYTFSSVFAH